jgi:hypothetical protein
LGSLALFGMIFSDSAREDLGVGQLSASSFAGPRFCGNLVDLFNRKRAPLPFISQGAEDIRDVSDRPRRFHLDPTVGSF